METTPRLRDDGPPSAQDRAEQLFASAVALPALERDAFLCAQCESDPTLHAELASLVAAHDACGTFLEPGAAAVAAVLAVASQQPAEGAPGSGTIIDRYRLAERIGEGGMGQVYRATRADGQFAHDVAIKITRAVVEEGELARRFKAERQILAVLHHPHIVGLLDAGALPNGQAYLVMELVDGLPITQHCHDRHLTLTARLDLFRQVCAAVHYAHRHGVVHRDLKPANMLVTTDGVPKVVDFGIAKLFDPLGGTGFATQTGITVAPLTPNYASPEQVRGLPITTVSDVYSLGVVLYELVTGERPYDTTGQTLDSVLDLVAYREPTRPSAVRERARGDTTPYPGRLLRGDLDAIVLKAIAKDPERRYASADELAEDLSRYLKGRPVVAREPSLGYVLHRLARRHRAAVSVAAIALVGLLALLGLALWQWRVATIERGRAERRFSEVRQLANALIFKVHDGVVPLAGSTEVRRTIVAEAVGYLERLEPEAVGDASLQFDIAKGHRRIGQVLGDPTNPNLGDREGGLRHLEKARTLLEPLSTRADTAPEALNELVVVNRTMGALHAILGRRPQAQIAAERARAVASQLVARQPGDRRWRETLAAAEFTVATLAAPGAAVQAWQRVRDAYATLLAEAPDDPRSLRNLALAEKYLGGSYDVQREDGLAERHYRRALELDERVLAQFPEQRQARFDVAIDLANLAVVATFKRDFAEAARLLERSLALRQRIVDEDPRDVQGRGRLAVVQRKLGSAYRDVGRHRDAEALLRTAWATMSAARDQLSESWMTHELALIAGERATLARDQGARATQCQELRVADREWNRYLSGGTALSLSVQGQREWAARELATCGPPVP